MKKAIALLPLLLCVLSVLAFADEAPSQTTAKVLPVPKETSSITQHSVVINGRTIKYTATAGNLVINNDKGDAIGSFFYVGYTQDGVKNQSHRPVTFL
ncbi:MAG TPA: peptidase S10, partial [Gammaproteobacteria bacterium]|nr:peptidase S10 [Gammaproteobacteria bacterium]